MRTRHHDGRYIGPRFWLVLSAVALGVYLALAAVQGSTALALSCVLAHHDTYDTKGTQFFELRCGTQVAVLSIDGGADLARWLRQHDTQRLLIDLTPRTPQRLER